ncbi:MAG: polyprenol monophosphomannose synthase [Gemmatimonadales bacterium]
MPDRLLVILPTYNESENLPRLVPQILEQDGRLDVLVVDDNSPDGTGRMAEEFAARNPRIHVLHRPAKQGLGRAYLSGFAWGIDRRYDLLFEMDADFSHDPKYLPDLVAAIGAGADVAIGSRYQTGVNVINWPMARLLLSWFASKYARWITGLRLTDLTAGFKCFRREVLASIPLDQVRSNGYAFQIEMSFRAMQKGFRLVEVPIVFVDRTEGKSKMNKKIVWEAVWMVWWLRLAALFGRI